MKYLLLIIVFFCFFDSTFCLTGKFWQVTDQHYDWKYKYQSRPSHGNCRKGEGDAGYYGDYNCDIPWLTVASAIEEMSKVEPNVDFVINSGDTMPHADGSAEEKLQTIVNTTNLIRMYFPNTPVFFAPGNHDFEPKHGCQLGENPWLAEITQGISPILNPEQTETFLKGGYYSQVIEGLRVVIMNTVLYYKNNKYTRHSEGDPSDQYLWITSQIDEAYENNEKVLFVGHVPPGYAERFGSMNFHDQYNTPFMKVFEEHPHKEIILASLYGHLHSDSFRLTDNAGPLLLAPALTPWKNYHAELGVPNNLGMGRLFSYDKQDKTLLKYEQYSADLQTCNEDLKLKWKLEYDSSQEPFCMEDLSLKSYEKLFDQMLTDEEIFNHYLDFNILKYKPDPCGLYCKATHLCSTKYLHAPEYEFCKKTDYFTFILIGGKFWQVTDQHYDWKYKYQSRPSHGNCRKGEGDAGYYGDYNCDIPWLTLESAIEEMSIIEPNVDFVINSGDTFPHAGGSAEEKLQTIVNTTNLIRMYFPNITVFYSPVYSWFLDHKIISERKLLTMVAKMIVIESRK
ncbi:sphingomyelin phosphodiesterase [Anaeramoeba flamelloides]|uniref:Sphingomyelin phosphodiesterase n=1 Tax=Anaeramoeba flamelloides TaxID=1746091 RepID=A0AAV8A6T2_9EUKA|nr:sphingomyelin phosphodiesterase [Anaeramoeba flamelloides]